MRGVRLDNSDSDAGAVSLTLSGAQYLRPFQLFVFNCISCFFPPLSLSLPSLGSLLLCLSLSLFVFVSVCHCCMEAEHDGSISVLFTQPMSFPNCTAPATFAEAGDFHV